MVSKRVFSYVDLSNPVWGQAEFRILPSRILASSYHHNFIQIRRWMGNRVLFGISGPYIHPNPIYTPKIAQNPIYTLYTPQKFSRLRRDLKHNKIIKQCFLVFFFPCPPQAENFWASYAFYDGFPLFLERFEMFFDSKSSDF